MVSLTLEVSFDEAYREWRDQARPYNPESIVQTALAALREPVQSRFEDIRRAPWQIMLIVKWVCQDSFSDNHQRQPISPSGFHQLRQNLWEFPEKISGGIRDTLPLQLFLRRLLNPQIGLQRPFSSGFVREAALLAQQAPNDQLRLLFERKAGMTCEQFLDLALATYAAILDGKRRFDLQWYSSLQKAYPESVIRNFVSAISRTFPELVAFARALPDRDKKVASEYYEFPVVARYPFFRTGDVIECWHPAVFYRGMESFVHWVLSEEGQNYMDRFSKLFEGHVMREAEKVGAPIFKEKDLMKYVTAQTRVPDALLSFPNCNVFIESKAGLFDESVMTVGHSEVFSHKTKALKSAIAQARATSASLRREKRAPINIRSAESDYLLIVTNRELSASNGRALAAMYPADSLASANEVSDHFLPLEHVYILSIEDFERLVAGTKDLSLPSFLSDCVQADLVPSTAVHFFEQRLDMQLVPRKLSDLVSAAINRSSDRLQDALSCSQ